MDWWTQNKDAISAIGAAVAALLAVGGIIWAVIKYGVLRGWQRKLRVDVGVFEVIADPAVLLPKLFATENDDSPLADHNIKYQPRDPNRDIQAELKSALNRSRYLLITAPTGYGKTREAGLLAQTLMLEGWRVLRITKTGWLDVPKTLPKELNDNRSRILIFLDDLNGMFSTGTRTESPRAEKIPLLSEASYHDRLLQVLDFFEGACTEREIRVIATARSEADQWKLLNFDEKDRLWKRFERFELPEPADSAIIGLLDDAAKQADMKADPEDYEAIAHKSDGTYRNILLNLRRWEAQNNRVNKDDFTETLQGSWREVYEATAARHPAVTYVYDAIDVLNQAEIELFPFLIAPAAEMLWGGNLLQKFLRRRAIQRSIQYLTNDTNILRIANGRISPSDGQIEAKERTVSWTSFKESLARLLLKHSHQRTAVSLYNFAGKCYDQKEFDLSLELISRYKKIKPKSPAGYYATGLLLDNLKRYAEAEAAYRKAIELDPDYAAAYYNLGILLRDLKRYDDAEAAYRKAIELDPQDAAAYSNLGLLLYENLKRYAEAEAAYRKAIELDPDLAQAYYNLGNLLSDLKRYDEAEAAFRKAIELEPQDAAAYNNLGNLLRGLKRYDEAEAAYRKAIELDPQDAAAYNNLGNLLRDLKRYDEAEAAYRKAIELDPQDAAAYYNLGVLLDENLKRYDEAEAAYRKAIELEPALAQAYSNLGNLLSGLKRYDEAEAAYRKAIELEPQDTKAYSNLGVLLHENLKRYDEAEAAYRKAIELEPDYAAAYSNLGILLKNLKRYDEAEAAYRKAIELEPALAQAYSNLGILLKNLKRYDEAEAAYRKAIELEPQDAADYNNLGILLKDLKRYDEAEAAYRKAIELDPQYAAAYSNLGLLLHENLKRYAEAEADYRKAIELDPALAQAYSNLGVLLHENLKRYAEAEAAYRKAIELEPQDAAAYNNLGNLLRGLKRYDEAEAAYRKAIELEPLNDRRYIGLIHLFRFDVEKPQEALPLLAKRLELNSENYHAHLAAASIEKQLGTGIPKGNIEKARQFMPEDDWYNRACLESVCDNFDLAFEYLEKAAKQKGFDPAWAWKDPDLQWIRDDPRFEKIAGPKPE